MLYLKCGDNMKKVLKIFMIIFGIIYAGIALILTVCLLNYNDYNITEIGDKTLIIVRDEELKPDFEKGDLVIVTKNKNEDIKIGDKIFFYDTYKNQISVNLGNIINKDVINEEEVTYTMNGNYPLSSEYVIGKSSTSNRYKNIGSILAVLESRFGFLFIIIFPILILFIYEIYAVIIELKTPIDEIENEENEKNNKKNSEK